MNKSPRHRRAASAFTIVELLVVIVIIAILASVTIVAYNGIQTQARNAAIINEGAQWSQLLKMYNVTYGSFPVSDGYYCLGTGFPIGTNGTANCRDYAGVNYVPQSGNATLMAALTKAGSLPNGGDRTPINGSLGPFIYINQSNPSVISYIGVVIVLSGSNASVCPANQTVWWTDNSSKVFCQETYALKQ